MTNIIFFIKSILSNSKRVKKFTLLEKYSTRKVLSAKHNTLHYPKTKLKPLPKDMLTKFFFLLGKNLAITQFSKMLRMHNYCPIVIF